MIQNNRPQKIDLPDKNKSLIFVYATLLHPRSRDLAFHHKESATKAILPNWKKVIDVSHMGEQLPKLEQTTHGELKGDVLEISPEDLANLKKWEEHYHLIPVKLKDGRQAQAFQLKE